MRFTMMLLSILMLSLPMTSFQKRGNEDLTLVSFNVRYGTPGDGENKWKSRRGKVFAIFQRYKEGIIGVQEALPNQINEILKAVPDLRVIARSRMADETKGEATAIFYNRALWKPESEETYWLSDTPDVAGSTTWGNTLPRITTEVVFKNRKTGKKVRIINTHLDHRSQPARIKSTELMLNRVEQVNDDIPTFMIGDFNAHPDNELVAEITKTFKDSYSGGKFDGCTFHSWHGGSNCPRIDYIFYQEDRVKIMESGIDRFKRGRYYPSDHYPIYAKVKL